MSNQDFHSAKRETCPRLDECLKIKMVLDKDLLPGQYVEAANAVCARCHEPLRVPLGEDGCLAPRKESGSYD